MKPVLPGQSQDPEAQRAASLAAYDEAIRRGEIPCEPGTELTTRLLRGSPSGQTSPELAGMEACLQLLSRAWPRVSPLDSSIESRKQIGRFEIQGLLGHGGFGIVYLARDPRLARMVALKIPRPHVLAHAELHERFRREARAAAALDHPNIVQILETGETGPLSYIASIYCDGPTLAQWLRQQARPVPPRIAAKIVAALAEAVDYSHRRGVMHRDLKPSNVLLFPNLNDSSDDVLSFTPRLTDFGLAKLRETEISADATSLLLGTPVYMAPEQMRARNGADPVLGDVYSLGVILYELLIGRPPFQGSSFGDVYDQAHSVEPAPPRRLRRDVPLDLETICLKCLEKEPERRYPTAAALLTDLRNFLSGQPTIARPAGPLGLAARWIRRHPDRATLLGVTTTALLAVLGVWLWSTAKIASQRDVIAAARKTARLHETAMLTARIRERSQNRSPGWQDLNLSDLGQAAGEIASPDERRQLRNEAVEALCSVELRRVAVLEQDFDGYGLAYSPDGNTLAVGHNSDINGQGFVELFNTETRKSIRRLLFDRSPALELQTNRRNRLEGVRSLLFSEDGQRLTVGTRGGTIHCWSVTTGEPSNPPWQAHDLPVISLARNSLSDLLVSLSGDDDPRVRFWRESTGELLLDQQLRSDLGQTLVGLNDSILLINDVNLERWQFDPQRNTSSILWSRPHHGALLTLHPDRKTVLCDPPHELLAVAVDTGDVVRNWTDWRRKQIHTGDRHALQVSRDSRWLLTSANDGLKLWDLLSGTVIATIGSSGNSRVSAAFHPRRPELALTREGRIEIWQLAHTEPWTAALSQSHPLLAADMSRNGRTLAGVCRVSGGEFTGFTRELDSPHEGSQTLMLAHAHPWVTLSRDGTRVSFSGTADDAGLTVAAANGFGGSGVLAPGEIVSVFSPDGRQLWYLGTTVPSADERNPLPTVPTGLVGAFSVPGSQELFHWTNDRSQRELSRSAFLGLAVGNAHAAASSIDLRVRLFNADSGSLTWTSPAANQIVDSIALDDRERVVLCGTRSGRFIGLAVSNGGPLFDVSAHDETVTSVSSAGDLAVTGGQDGRVVVWRLHDRSVEPLFQIGPLSGAVRYCVLSHDAARLAVFVEHEVGVRILELTAVKRELQELGLAW